MKVRRRLLPGRSHEHHVLAALADNLDVELPMAYATIDLRTSDGQRWPFVLLRSRVPSTQDGWDRAVQLALRWLAEPVNVPDLPDPFAWLRNGRESPRLDSEPLHDVERMARTLGRRVASTHVAIGDARAAAGSGSGSPHPATTAAKDRELADAALAALADFDVNARSRWATLMDSPAAARILGSRQVLGALARWRWTQDDPTPVDPDDSTPGVVGEAGDYGERDIGALAADFAYAAVTALQQTGVRDLQDPAGRAWWAVATWALVRGWHEELAAAGRHTLAMSDVIEGLRLSLLWRLLVDAVGASEARKQMARAVLIDLAARPVGDQA
jgi:hypothetical protein